jgi:thioredoxin 1
MNKVTFFNRLRENPNPVVVDVWAPWCGPCKSMAPALDQVSGVFAGRVDLWKINADEEADLLRALGIWSVPTMIVFQGEREVVRCVGAQSSSSLEAIFQTALTGEPPPVTGIPLKERLLRLAVGLVLIVTGFALGPSLVLLALGGIALFTAVHDRCPLWQAVRPYLSSLFGRNAA